MFRERLTVKGKITATVLGPDGLPKKRDRLTLRLVLKAIASAKWRFHELEKMLRYEYGVNHNIVTNQGDALIADLLSDIPVRAPVDNLNGVIAVGTGWTGTNPKLNTGVNTPVGSPKAMSALYPKTKGAWGAADDNVIQYRAFFAAGDLNASGIDEAALGNGTDNLAYGQVTPEVTVSSEDTLQVDWEITFLGA